MLIFFLYNFLIVTVTTTIKNTNFYSPDTNSLTFHFPLLCKIPNKVHKVFSQNLRHLQDIFPKISRLSVCHCDGFCISHKRKQLVVKINYFPHCNGNKQKHFVSFSVLFELQCRITSKVPRESKTGVIRMLCLQ